MRTGTFRPKIEATEPPASDHRPLSIAASRAPPPRILYCSFCGKGQHEVRKLIAGPTVFICDEGVALCADIVESGM
jgi:hypothetical protein